MVSTTLIALVVSLGILADNVLATPSPKVDDVQTAHLKFRASSSPDTYDLTIQADGNVVKTDRDKLAIGLVDAPDYYAASLCKFETPGKVKISSKVAGDRYTQQVVLDPPQPILSVKCQGMCVQTYGACYDVHGQPVGPCCNGFCMANRCRPWNIGHHDS
ncbi:hypothetical protein G6O67_005214 [Ophiocordyceps sinensis]|uniref:Uncharacterized protein n=2 Tax=Ophiocordyceps sinensis TaxID=72228 RepID=A0A8H4PQZ3_9HYPO|nr:hypothetical protein OCS_01291 [Ophiocordyceps sinensis CO18]KAF4508885.1 hypothetical protein G6O67_005214 [Ophiocordyceps sinensis]